jgi:hypothetical protein
MANAATKGFPLLSGLGYRNKRSTFLAMRLGVLARKNKKQQGIKVEFSRN